MSKQILAFTMALCLAILSFPLEVFAEEANGTPVETDVIPAITEPVEEEASTPVPVDEDISDPEPFEVPEVVETVAPESTEIPEAEMTAVPETTEAPEAEATIVPESDGVFIDTGRDASFSPDFERGYAAIFSENAEVQPEEGEAFLLSRGVIVYVSARDGHFLEIWLDTQDGVLSGWTEDTNLRPMDQEEVDAFVEEESLREDAAYFADDESLPLALVDTVIFLGAEEDSDETSDEQSGKLEIIEESISGRTGEFLELTVDTDAADRIIWTTSDESVAVCAAGRIEFIGTGTCEIAASIDGGISDICLVTVKGAPETLTLPYKTLTIGVGESFRLEPDVGGAETTFTYASSKPKYAKVSADGVVKGIQKGSSTIGVRTDNGLAAFVSVKVCSAPKKVTVSPQTLVLGVGENARLGYSLPKNTAGAVKFTSSDPEIVSVNADTGEVLAVGEGSAKITAKTYNGKKAYAVITVKSAPEKVNVVPESFEIGVGQILTVKTSVDADAAGKIELSSGDENVLVVSGSRIKGVTPGKVELIASAYNGVSERVEITVRPAPEKVTLPYKKLTVGVGEIVQLTPDCGDAVGGFTYASSKTKYVKAASDGRICGIKSGSAKIKVSTYNGKSASVTVKVSNAPKKITVSPQAMTLGVGETAILGYELPKNTAGSVSFTSSNPEIATVDPKTGRITAVAIGSVKIAVQTYNGKKAYASVEVKSAPESVSAVPVSTVIGVGQILSVKTAVNEGAAGKVELSSSDESCLVVSGSRIKGVAPGTVELIAAAYNGAACKMQITVCPAPKKISLPHSTLKIGIGETVRLTPDAGEGMSGFTFTSSKTKYVKVSADGMLKGVRKGKSKVSVSSYNGKKAYVTVEVCAAPKGIVASASELLLGVGQTARIRYKLPDKTASAVRYESADPSVASVDESTGTVTALSPGETEIVLSTFNGKTARCTVRVSAAPDSISVGRESMEMGAGQSMQLSPVIPEGSRTSIAYASDNKAVVSVSADGRLTALKRGTATVRISTHVPEVFADLKVTVWDAPSGVSVKESQMKVLINQTFVLEPVIPKESIGFFEFSSSRPEVASIDADGTVKTLSVGTTILTVTTYNKKTASVELTVWDPLHPEKLVLLNTPDVLNLSDKTYAIKYRIEPETANHKLVWTSSNPDVATVDNKGLITLHGYGYSVITVVSERNSAVGAQFTLGVQLKNLTLTIPARVTQESGIKSNLAKIDKIRKSAISQVEALMKGGVISSSDAAKRKSMINNIFEDYAFPWKTPEFQPYWNAANSEDGVKDFKPDRVYYGMPYMSGGSSNRRYNSAKAVAENRYVDTGKGYYMLNRKKLLNGTYTGNDCSSLVSMAIWGTNSSHSGDRTGIIATNSAYRTIKGYKDMRPGDLLCKANRHVVMFLYYANPEKTKIMIIENGGAEAGTNTVHCDVHELSYYTEIGYQVRRLKTLG